MKRFFFVLTALASVSIASAQDTTNHPPLTMTISGPCVNLTWPTNFTGFTLGFMTNLASPTVWQTNSTAPVVINGQNVVTNPITGTQMFFRLTQ